MAYVLKLGTGLDGQEHVSTPVSLKSKNAIQIDNQSDLDMNPISTPNIVPGKYNFSQRATSAIVQFNSLDQKKKA